MKIVFFGTPQFAVPSLKALIAHPNFEVLGIVTQPDKRRGRGGKITPSPVKVTAQDLIPERPIWQPARIKTDTETLAKLDALEADAFVVIAYGQILSQTMLDMPRWGCVNAHGSLLPEYRGAAPIQWCLYRGERETGVTTMLMDAGMDTGPMLMEEKIEIGLLDNAWQISNKLATLSADMLPVTLEKLQQQMIRPTPQDGERATYAPLIEKEDYALNWTKSAKALHDQIRGFYPNCVTQFQGKPMKVLMTVPLGAAFWTQLPSELSDLQALHESASINETHTPGDIVAILKHYGPVIQTGEGQLLLREVKPQGKRALSGWDFANGNRLSVGETLE